MHHYARTAPIIVLLAALLTPTQAYAQAKGSLESWPDWVQEGMAKEVRKTKLRDVEMPIDTISAKLPGKPGVAQAIDDGWYLNSDIKAGSLLECYVYTTGLDLASLTNILAENSIAAVIQTNGAEIGPREIYDTDAGVVNGLPYLALEWIYTMSANEQTMVGFTKVRAAVKGDFAFACVHNYLGYRKTFAKAFSDFTENVEYEATTPAPYYEEVAKLDYNDIGAGITYFSFTEDSEGHIKTYTTEASIMPVSASTIMTSDSIIISYTSLDGELINSRSIGVQNGELISNLSLMRNEDGDWVSGGTLQGKEITSVLDGTVSPTSELRMITTARDLFAGDETAVTLDAWVPTVDPTSFLQTIFTRDDAEVAGQANVSMGPINYVGQFDEYGSLTTAAMTVGPMTINIERLWSRGVPAK